MKKTLIAVVAVILVAALATGAYFLFSSEKNNGSVSVIVEEFNDNPSLLISFMNRPAKFTKVLEEEYQLGANKTAEFYECPEEWLTYDELITIFNSTDEAITVCGLEIAENGKNGVYIGTVLDAEYEIAPGSNTSVYFNILCDNGDLSTDEAKALVAAMDIKITYKDASLADDDSAEYSTADVNKISE